MGNESSRGFGKLLEKHDCQRKVATGEHAKTLFACARIDLSEFTLREAGGPHYDVRAVVKRGQDIRLGTIRLGVFHEDIAWNCQRLYG